MRFTRTTRALSLLEVVVALGILSVVLVSVAAAMMSGVSVNRLMAEQQQAVAFANGAMNYVVANKDFRSTYADASGTALPKDGTQTNVWQRPFTAQRTLEYADFNGYTGDLVITPYEYDDSVSPPGAALQTADWLAADCFEVIVTVTWTPHGAANTRTITVRTYYHPQT